jgi:hypothetical protein
MAVGGSERNLTNQAMYVMYVAESSHDSALFILEFREDGVRGCIRPARFWDAKSVIC